MTSESGFGFLANRAYDPPSWASHLSPIPSHTCSLAHVTQPLFLHSLSLIVLVLRNWFNIDYVLQLPTPIHKWNLPNLPPKTEVWLKVLNVLLFCFVIRC